MVLVLTLPFLSPSTVLPSRQVLWVGPPVAWLNWTLPPAPPKALVLPVMVLSMCISSFVLLLCISSNCCSCWSRWTSAWVEEGNVGTALLLRFSSSCKNCWNLWRFNWGWKRTAGLPSSSSSSLSVKLSHISLRADWLMTDSLSFSVRVWISGAAGKLMLQTNKWSNKEIKKIKKQKQKTKNKQRYLYFLSISTQCWNITLYFLLTSLSLATYIIFSSLCWPSG